MEDEDIRSMSFLEEETIRLVGVVEAVLEAAMVVVVVVGPSLAEVSAATRWIIVVRLLTV